MKSAGEYILEMVERSPNIDDWNEMYENKRYLLNEMAKWMTDYVFQFKNDIKENE